MKIKIMLLNIMLYNLFVVGILNQVNVNYVLMIKINLHVDLICLVVSAHFNLMI